MPYLVPGPPTDPSMASHRDKLPSSTSREREDELDWQENQARSPHEQRRTDGAFLFSSAAGTALWLLVGIGTAGGAVAVAFLVARLFSRH